MRVIGRRDFIAGLGLGSAAALLTPLCARLVRRAQAAPSSSDARLIVFTDNNGWGLETDDRGVDGPGYAPGANSMMFASDVAAPDRWTLPTMLEPLAEYHQEMCIIQGLWNYRNAGGAPHGTGLSTLTAREVDNPDDEGSPPPGISIDRYIGKELAARHDDLVDSTNMSVKMYGQYSTSTSCDGYGKRADTYDSPLDAYQAYFGRLTGLDPEQVERQLRLHGSLFDGMLDDLERVRGRLAGFEREKLDQALASTREVERKISEQLTRLGQLPDPPLVDGVGLSDEVVQGLLEITALAHIYDVTHVSHVACIGYNTSSDSWRGLIPEIREDDTHNRLYHGDQGNYASSEEREADIRRIVQWKATRLERMLAQLESASLRQDTLVVWINAGGYMHHRGENNVPLVMIGSLGGRIRAPRWQDYTEYVSGELYRLRGTRHIGDGFATIAQAMGVDTPTFGEASVAQGHLPGLLA